MADLNFLAKTDEAFEKSSAAAFRGRDVFSVVFSFSAAILFVISLLAMGGLFLYYQYETKTIRDLAATKQDILNDLRPELIQRLLFVNNALSQARQLLQSHIFASQVFPIFLEKNVHQSVFVDAFKLSVDNYKLEIGVKTQNYTTLADQIRVFENDPMVEKVTFENPAIADDGLTAAIAVIFKPVIFQNQQ